MSCSFDQSKFFTYFQFSEIEAFHEKFYILMNGHKNIPETDHLFSHLRNFNISQAFCGFFCFLAYPVCVRNYVELMELQP
jgi:hypothetical protein